MIAESLVETPCAECGAVIEVEAWRTQWAPTCDACSERLRAAEMLLREENAIRNRAIWDESLALRREHVRTEVLRKIGDSLGRRITTTDVTHLDFNFPLWEAVKAFRPDETFFNLGIWGASGFSKTRVSCLLSQAIMEDLEEAQNELPQDYRNDAPNRVVKDLTIDECRHHAAWDQGFLVTSGLWLDRLMETTDFEGRSEQRKQVDRLKHRAVLFIDDLDKLSPTPYKLRLFLDIADHRHGNELCTIWTGNTHPREWLAGADPRFAESIVRRIADERDGAVVYRVE